jgi:hypothetical protein
VGTKNRTTPQKRTTWQRHGEETGGQIKGRGEKPGGPDHGAWSVRWSVRWRGSQAPRRPAPTSKPPLPISLPPRCAIAGLIAKKIHGRFFVPRINLPAGMIARIGRHCCGSIRTPHIFQPSQTTSSQEFSVNNATVRLRPEDPHCTWQTPQSALPLI